MLHSKHHLWICNINKLNVDWREANPDYKYSCLENLLSDIFFYFPDLPSFLKLSIVNNFRFV